MAGSKLVIPIEASHLRLAREQALPDQDSFQQQEMSWLKINNPLLARRYTERLQRRLRRNDTKGGFAALAGSMLGHRAVRLCADETGTYTVAYENFQRNEDLD